MPETLLVRDFSAGWCPSDDAVNGRPNALLQMDNVELDANGAIQLCGGTQKLYSVYSGNAHTMFSRYINNLRCDYAACANGSIYRNNTQIAAGGDATNAAFSTAFNFTLICSGSAKYKDNGLSLVNLGVLPPTVAPTITQSASNAPWAVIAAATFFSPSSVGFPGSGHPIVLVSGGAGGTTYLLLTPQALVPGGPGSCVIQTYGAPVSNCAVLSSIAGSGTSTDIDFVTLNGYTQNPFGVGVQLDILLVSPNINGDVVSDYYTYTVPDLSQANVDLINFDKVSGTWTLRIPRASFNRIGGGSQDWTTVYGYRLTILTPSIDTSYNTNVWPFAVGEPLVIQGGTAAQFGTYQWTQVNVNNTGSYLAKSVIGPLSDPVVINGNCALITPQVPTDPQVNQIWIFRKGGNLGQWSRTIVITSPYSATYDAMGDQAALDLDITINVNLISVQSIPDKIYDIIGPVQSRWYYFTTNFMYPSDVNDPDLVDSSIAVRICGSTSELLMWARAVSASVVIVGTSIDCYLLTGTFTTFPDNTVDVYYQNLGVKFPPVSYDAMSYGGAVYYMAADGWRMVLPTSFGTTYSSQNNQLIVAPNTDRLYKGESCYGYLPPLARAQPGSVRFPVAIVKNKLWCFVTSTGRLEIYDFTRNYWRTVNYGLGDATACTFTQDNKILACYATDKITREIDLQTSKLIDGITRQTFKIMNTFKDNGKPRQRKDTYTFKSRCYTGAGSIQISITSETGQTFVIPTVMVQPGINPSETFIDLSQPLGTNYPKSYMIELTGTTDNLLIEDWSVDYDARPVPVTFLRFTGLNYGTTARKRIYTVPFQIDTLGNPVIVQALVDGSLHPQLSINSVRRQSFDYEFTAAEFGTLGNQNVGRDYEWTINGQGREFEWYDFQQIRNIEVFPDPRACYFIPKTNFGQPVQKRIRTWPFVIDTRGNNVTFTAYVDNVSDGISIFNTNGERATVFHYFTTDVFGIDYSGVFVDPTGLMELWQVPGLNGPSDTGVPPDSVQNLPLMHEYDQVGPLEIFRWGKVVRMALRTFSNGTPIPFKVFMSDSEVWSGNFNVTAGIEDEYIIDLPKGSSGRIIRVELGPCNFTFARYFMKFQVMISGAQKDTEMQWITIPGITSQLSGGI